MVSGNYFWFQKIEIRDSKILDLRQSASSWRSLAHEDSASQGRSGAASVQLGPDARDQQLLATLAVCHTWAPIPQPSPWVPCRQGTIQPSSISPEASTGRPQRRCSADTGLTSVHPKPPGHYPTGPALVKQLALRADGLISDLLCVIVDFFQLCKLSPQ